MNINQDTFDLKVTLGVYRPATYCMSCFQRYWKMWEEDKEMMKGKTDTEANDIAVSESKLKVHSDGRSDDVVYLYLKCPRCKKTYTIGLTIGVKL